MSYTKEVTEAAARLNMRPEAVQTYLDAGIGKHEEGVDRCFHATIKPIGSACNLRCAYCYYLSKQALLQQQEGRPAIHDELLEQFIADYIAAQDCRDIVFTWHGGEPSLSGLPFFRRVVELQRKHLPAGRSVLNDMQTNGTLIDDEWCAFLAENQFLVGLSLDGPHELHDRYRTTRQGDSSFARAFAAAKLLRKHGIALRTLSTVNRQNARRPLEVYRFLRDEVGARHMQLIPCVEPRQFEGIAPGALPDSQVLPVGDPRVRPGHPDSVVTDWSVDPDDWGTFLIHVFDEWWSRDRGTVKIDLFESLLAQGRGEEPLVCSNARLCGRNIALESDGRVYSCDYFVYPEHQLGTLGSTPLAQMMFSLKQLEFGLSKFNSLSSECRACAHLKLCWGECPRTRILKAADGQGRLSYLCAGWKSFFRESWGRIVRA